jgi:hypothetical protein
MDSKPPTELLMRGLFGEPLPTTARGKALWVCRRERATRAWIKPGCYAWWRFTDYLKAAQKDLLALRGPSK